MQRFNLINVGGKSMKLFALFLIGMMSVSAMDSVSSSKGSPGKKGARALRAFSMAPKSHSDEIGKSKPEEQDPRPKRASIDLGKPSDSSISNNDRDQALLVVVNEFEDRRKELETLRSENARLKIESPRLKRRAIQVGIAAAVIASIGCQLIWFFNSALCNCEQ